MLGAGLAGLSAAWVLSRLGAQVTVLEKSERVGGLAVTLSRDGYRYDLGAHNIHSRHEHVLTFLQRYFPGFFPHRPTFRVLRRGRFIVYPIRGAQVFTSLPLWKIAPAMADFLMARVRLFFTRSRADEDFQSWIVHRFGRILFEEFFRDYPSKVWRLPPDRIDKYVSEKRIPLFSITELLRAVLLNAQARVDHQEVTDRNFYLTNGIGEIADFLAREIVACGGTIVRPADIERVVAAGDRVERVVYRTGADAVRSCDCDQLLSTIPLDQLVRLLPSSEAARAAADRLEYCATRFLFLKIRNARPLPGHMLYFPQEETWFSRLTDMGRFSPAMMPPQRTLYCLEFPCEENDAIWRAPEEKLIDHALDRLRPHELVAPDAVEGGFTEAVTHTYPRFRLGFAAQREICREEARRFANLLSYGRQGDFHYANVDAVLHQGFHAAAAVLMAEQLRFSCREWFVAQMQKEALQ